MLRRKFPQRFKPYLLAPMQHSRLIPLHILPSYSTESQSLKSFYFQKLWKGSSAECHVVSPLLCFPHYHTLFSTKLSGQDSYLLLHVPPPFFFEPFFSSLSWKALSPSRPQSIKLSVALSYYLLGWSNFLKTYHNFYFCPHFFSLKLGTDTDVSLECQLWSFLSIFL